MSTTPFTNISVSGSVNAGTITADSVVTNVFNVLTTDFVTGTLHVDSVIPNNGNSMNLQASGSIGLNSDSILLASGNIQIGNSGGVGISSGANITFKEASSANVNFTVVSAPTTTVGAYVHRTGGISIHKNSLTAGYSLDCQNGITTSAVLQTVRTENPTNATNGALRVSGGAGIQKDIYCGANLNVGNIILRGAGSLFGNINLPDDLVVGNSITTDTLYTTGKCMLGAVGTATAQLHVVGNARIVGNLDVFGGTLYVKDNPQYVGILNTNPLFELDVKGRANITSNVTVGGNINTSKNISISGNIINDDVASISYLNRLQYNTLYPRNDIACTLYCSVNNTASTTLSIASGGIVPFAYTNNHFFSQGCSLASGGYMMVDGVFEKTGYKVFTLMVTLYIRSATTLTSGYLTLQRAGNTTFTAPVNMSVYYLRNSYVAGETIQAIFTGIIPVNALGTERYLRVTYTGSAALPISTNGPANQNAISYFLYKDVIC